MIGNNEENHNHNHSDNEHFNDILQANMQRRAVLKGGLGAMVATLFAPLVLTAYSDSSSSTSTTPTIPSNSLSLLGFKAVPISSADTAIVPEGYKVQVLAEWGRSISNPNLRYVLPFTSGSQQLDAIGSHHDGMHFFPINGSSNDGLLVMNHEYVEPRYMHRSALGQALSSDDFPVYQHGGQDLRHSDDVFAELCGHGVSVIRIQRQTDGEWQVVADRLNRRITGLTVIEISGPVRGSDWVKTKYSPDGSKTRGTLNNCSHGVTPWNTYLTCEENWAGYFRNRAQSGDNQPREHQRYGVSAGVSRYGWELADSPPGEQDIYARFNSAPTAADASADYRNEPNCFGWVVEFDPFNPDSVPVKRTQLGRFAHEGVVFQPAVEGQPVVCYSGDDARNEYIYKFISAEPYHKATAGGHLLDHGTLYVAKFNADGSGEWLPLVWGQGALQPLNQGEVADCSYFKDQADVLVNTRLAADSVGATKMDRPEWGAVDPKTGMVYFTLTNNTTRGGDSNPVDKANPRAKNRWGHIIRWTEANNDPQATRFNWDIFILAGPKDDSNFAGKGLDDDQMFNSPDGLWFDPDGRLWIQTDISESLMNSGDYAQFGNNQMLACDVQNKVLRRFFTGPLGQEITGVVTTPDQKTMFINVQHPGATISADDFVGNNITGKGNWPLGGSHYARSATVVVSKEDGGIIGS